MKKVIAEDKFGWPIEESIEKVSESGFLVLDDSEAYSRSDVLDALNKFGLSKTEEEAYSDFTHPVEQKYRDYSVVHTREGENYHVFKVSIEYIRSGVVPVEDKEDES